MFTGIVQELCPIYQLTDDGVIRRLTVDMGTLAEGLEPGASVAVNGVCLTVTHITGTRVTFDVIQETLRVTNLGGVGEGSRVNVERSFRVGDEVGGHLLSGHVCDALVVRSVDQNGGEHVITLAVPDQWMKYLMHKGFVALDGASLTIASVDERSRTITVCLIPETIARTTLGSVVPGDRLNLEIDAQTQAVVETVERMLASPEWQTRYLAR